MLCKRFIEPSKISCWKGIAFSKDDFMGLASPSDSSVVLKIQLVVRFALLPSNSSMNHYDNQINKSLFNTIKMQ